MFGFNTPAQNTPVKTTPSLFGMNTGQQLVPSGMPNLSTPGQMQMPSPLQPQASIQVLRKDRRPVSYSTKIDELDDNSRALLLALEKRIQQHREECRQLETFERLKGGKPVRDELDSKVHMYSKKVQGLVSLLKSDKEGLDSLYEAVMKLVRQTESISNSAQRTKLRNQTLGHTTAGATLPGDLGRPPPTPPPFLLEAFAYFTQMFEQIQRAVTDLENLHLKEANRHGNASADGMSKILENFTVYFNHVVATYSNIHQELEQFKKSFAAMQKAHGVDRDYFLEADRKVAAAEDRLKKEAEQRKQGYAQNQPVVQPQSAAQPAVGAFGATGGQSTPGQTPLFGSTLSTPGQAFGGVQPTAPSILGAPQTPTFSFQSSASQPSLFSPTPAPNMFGSVTPGFGGFPASTTSASSKKKSGGKRGK